MDDRRRGTWLVVAQAACAAGLGLPGRRLWPDRRGVRLLASVLAGAGGAVAAWGAAGLGRRLRAHPEPPPDAVLRTEGVYARVRNPIYLGLLMAAAGVALARARPGACAATVALAAVVRAKARREEQALLLRFGAQYERYAATTPRWVPVRSTPRVGRRRARPATSSPR